ncbi:bifunctional DNA primase/polymerase [Algimonas arctica]|nr:bifunctional DNA primase/polymerase [Algimonas arctica]
MSDRIYNEWAHIYRALGLEPRPVTPGTKAAKLRGWQKPDTEIGQRIVESWDDKYRAFGIGLRMGTPLPGGGRLGALDIDHDSYVRPMEGLLGKIVSGRIGSKGAVIFVRVMGDLPNSKFKVKGEAGAEYGQVVECLFNKTFCVIPPTIHPDTNQPYRWIGTPLHEVDFSLLPRIGA